MDVYRLLPGDNCGGCGTKTCMGFATDLLERRKEVEDCSLMLEPEHADDLKKLVEYLTPPVRPVTIGEGQHAFQIGGEEVMYRHEHRWYNPTAMIIDVDDRMSEDELLKRIEWISSYSRIKIGEEISFDSIAVRSKSGEPDTFSNVVKLVSENTEYPLVLCSYYPEVLESGLKTLGGGSPLLYAATIDNWQEVTGLAMKYGCPVTISSSDLDEMVEISSRALAQGVKDDQIVLDPGTNPLDLKGTRARIVELRRAAIEGEFEPLRFPILGVPATAWVAEKDEDKAAFLEGAIGCMLMNTFVDAMIFHSTEIWSLMPALVLRQDIYQDPRNPASVDSKLMEVGNPDENSPILITGNFALTYYTVEGDCEGIDCYIFPVDTDGTSVTSSVAGDLMTAEKIVDAIEKHNFEEKVAHKTLVLPGDAAVLSGQIEVDSGWNVLVGPKDSAFIKDFLAENWPPKE